MAGPGYYGPPLSNHQHTGQSGDGGQLVNPSISGTLTTTGVINEGTATPAAAGDVVPYPLALMMMLLSGS